MTHCLFGRDSSSSGGNWASSCRQSLVALPGHASGLSIASPLHASHRSRRKPFFFSTVFLPFFSPCFFYTLPPFQVFYPDSVVGCASLWTWAHILACRSVFRFKYIRPCLFVPPAVKVTLFPPPHSVLNGLLWFARISNDYISKQHLPICYSARQVWNFYMYHLAVSSNQRITSPF